MVKSAILGVLPIGTPFTGISGLIRVGGVSPSNKYVEMKPITRVKLCIMVLRNNVYKKLGYQFKEQFDG